MDNTQNNNDEGEYAVYIEEEVAGEGEDVEE